MDMEGTWLAQVGTENQYEYNGKELNEDFGLNLYNYWARWYDAALGRWWSVDPLGEKYRELSPYNYGLNNPIRFQDLFGLEPYRYNWNTGGYEDINGNNVSWDQVSSSITSSSAQIHVLSASKAADKMTNNSIGHLINYLSDANINATVNFKRSNESFDITKIDVKDAVAVVGTKKSETVNFINKHLDKGYLSKGFKSWLNGEYLQSPVSSHPETSDGHDVWGYVTAITVSGKDDRYGNLLTDFGIKSTQEATAFFVLHGLGHLSGNLTHTNYSPNDNGFMRPGNALKNLIKENNGDLRKLIQDTVKDHPETMNVIYQRFPKN